jgi:hypothetical protein
MPQSPREPKTFLLLGLLSITGFMTSFGAYIVVANLPAYSRKQGPD